MKWLARTRAWFGDHLAGACPIEVATAAAVLALALTRWFEVALLGG